MIKPVEAEFLFLLSKKDPDWDWKVFGNLI
jgi:hypothetical protein